MQTTLIPADLLKKSDKVLFIAHLALGDFTYLQNFFKAFAEQNPQLKVHLWVDEVRRTDDAAQWPHLKKYSLYDWTAACPFFAKVYNQTYSPALYRESIEEARRENYPIVVSLATLRPHLYAGLARKISPDGLVIGMTRKVRFFEPHHLLAYHKLDAAMPPYRAAGPEHHISDVYAHWFRQLSGLEVDAQARFPFVDIPQQWRQYAEKRLAEWRFAPRPGKLVFINPYAKTKKRCWPLEHVAELIRAMQKRAGWQDACFIVNAVPQELANAHEVIGRYGLPRTELFSAEENFFQLPAILERCDLIVSVETAVMHLANAVHVPVVALMRQKNPEWVPIDRANSTVITAPHRRDWVKAVSVEHVLEAIR
ncbi:glycosyltransferase family 9 protein [Herbaspirillum sp.]|uniref:glycosyltransferase family 9 protein n=1 Tax=Herbaspirillum sp. TaxID=1890675 RepID=UPI001B184E68|nr:glycosyltransferase family 9 protein [Herbaspirillum sp.]MBO9537989.1 glycosyltransferase family 9 protein [Herbaspirillum sp.]